MVRGKSEDPSRSFSLLKTKISKSLETKVAVLGPNLLKWLILYDN